jgi:hypothetical protein
MTALQDAESRLHASCATMRAAGARLLARAQDAGSVRPDVDCNEVLALVAGLAWAGEHAPHRAGFTDKLLGFAMTGLEVRP